MLAAVAFMVADFGFGISEFRRWSIISFVFAAAIMFIPLLLLSVVLVIERLKPNKKQNKPRHDNPS
jgi:phosphoglycerol transferase MdoB-like AlkP superfamily enzyme